METVNKLVEIIISLLPLAICIWLTIIINRIYKFTENILKIQLEQKREQQEIKEKINLLLEKEHFSKKV